MYTFAHVYFSVAIIRAKQLISFPCQNLLALGGEDKCITVSNVDGDTIRQVCAHVIILENSPKKICTLIG